MSSAAPPAETGSELYSLALRQIDSTARLIDLNADMHKILRAPKRVFTVQVPIELESGEVRVFTGYRVQHNINRGPAIGGLRYQPSISVDQVTALAMLMTWKCALMGLPFGGSAGALDCDPRALSAKELERLTRRYATEMSVLIGPASDIVMPDLQTDSQVMAWIMDTYSMHAGFSVPAVVTGKHVSIGGSEGSISAGGRGVYHTLVEAAQLRGLKLRGSRVAIQGFGTTGTTIATLLHEAGCKVVALSDSTSGLFNTGGLNVPSLREYRRDQGSLRGFPWAEAISVEDVVTCDCDVLIPAAADSQITRNNAESVRASIVVEAASGPTTEEADSILENRGVMVLPEILAGAGAVTVSYFEWVQGLQENFWTERQVNERLASAMADAFAGVTATCKKLGVGYRAAAYAQAIGAVADATELRGIYP